MNLCVMATFDKKARVFALPFFAAHTDVAVRMFKEAANTADHQVCKHPEDFSLYYLGTFDDSTGFFNLTASPTPVVEAIQLKRGAQPEVPVTPHPEEPVQTYERN